MVCDFAAAQQNVQRHGDRPGLENAVVDDREIRQVGHANAILSPDSMPFSASRLATWFAAALTCAYGNRVSARTVAVRSGYAVVKSSSSEDRFPTVGTPSSPDWGFGRMPTVSENHATGVRS